MIERLNVHNCIQREREGDTNATTCCPFRYFLWVSVSVSVSHSLSSYHKIIATSFFHYFIGEIYALQAIDQRLSVRLNVGFFNSLVMNTQMRVLIRRVSERVSVWVALATA